MIKLIEGFNKAIKLMYGYTSQCRSCLNIGKTERREVNKRIGVSILLKDVYLCPCCNRFKSCKLFPIASYSLNKRYRYCNDCCCYKLNRVDVREDIDINSANLLQCCKMCKDIKYTTIDFSLCNNTNDCSDGICKSCFILQLNIVEGYLKYKTIRVRGRAKEKKLDFNLTYNYLLDLYKEQKGKCPITGLDLESTIRDVHKRENVPLSKAISVDRIDPPQGYIMGNIQLACYAANVFKLDLSMDQVKALVHIITSPDKSSFYRLSSVQPKNTLDDYLLYRFNESKHSAKKEGKGFTLTQEQLKDLYIHQDGKCAVTGFPMTYILTHEKRYFYNISIDRIDCSKGYSNDNVRLVW